MVRRNENIHLCVDFRSFVTVIGTTSIFGSNFLNQLEALANHIVMINLNPVIQEIVNLKSIYGIKYISEPKKTSRFSS